MSKYILFLLLVAGCESRSQKLMREGDLLIEKIEQFRSAKDSLPSSLVEFGESSNDEGPLYYLKQGPNEYIVYFGTALGESTVYSSKKGKWDESD
ncbi:hypothetical protein [Saprospira grandis]|uniref:hypothetical protein n=1 Tax=Saprospira grandis TaxID=1008 RepID=UPI0022DD14AF|nr:hypothetical protein [Saprospira grandis]WBM74140.1 hypothetical protein OP864_14220 [Saprospira grandis]